MTRTKPVRILGGAVGLLAGALLCVVAPGQSAPRSETGAHVLEARVIGSSVRGRPITAWHLEDRESPRGSTRTVVLIATMHGNEAAPQQILTALRDGRAIHGVDVWVVPVYNPDGLAAGTRRNAHGVDLNRNYPDDWADLDGDYESGPRAASEPETIAMMGFLDDVRPDFVLSFHQPLHGVDIDNDRPTFSRRVARTLSLPATSLNCGAVCHGTMTGWFNDHFEGFALTVEYGANPARQLMRRDAPRQVLRIFSAVAGRG